MSICDFHRELFSLSVRICYNPTVILYSILYNILLYTA